MITQIQELLLKNYKEKAFISAILCDESHNYYSFIKNMINIPLIVSNSVMVCINSVIEDQNTLKILNIILNSSTGLILGMISNFKIYEKINQYHQLYIKFNKLSNMIDSKMTNDLDNISNDFINNIMNDYDNIVESQEFSFPNKIKKKVKKQYENKFALPLSLSVDIVECDKNNCCIKNNV